MKALPRSWLLLVLPLALFLPFLDGFAYPLYSNYTDLAISHYPNAVFLRQALLEYGQIPLWSNTILSGYPFAANPLSGLWYPPGWPALLLPLPLGLNLMTALHLVFGGLGMARLLRLERLGDAPALAGGLAFELLPRMAAHLASGHLTLIYAAAWTPWLLAAARQSAQTERRMNLWEGVTLALIFLADVRWAAYAGLMWLGYSFHLFKNQRDGNWKLWAGSLAGNIALAGMLAAPLLLPLAEYTLRSTRQALTAAETLFLSLPPARLLGLLAPSFDGNTEWSVYAGATVLLPAVWAGCQPQIRKQARFWVIVFLVGLAAALGSYLPGAEFLAGLPRFSLLRVPARALLPVGMALAALLAWTVDSLANEDHCGDRRSFWARLATVGLAGFGLLLIVGSWAVTGWPQPGFLWGGRFALLSAGWILLRDRRTLSAKIWVTGIVALLLIDLVGINAQTVDFRSARQVLREDEAAAEYLAGKPGLFRVYSPSYSLAQQTSALYGLQMASGIDPLQLDNYAKYMESASGVPSAGYAVTLPPLAGGDPASDNRAYLPDPRQLGLLNVGYVLAEYDLAVDGLVEEARFGETRVYRNQLNQPRAWVLPADGHGAAEPLPVAGVVHTPNRIEVDAAGPGMLVLSDLAYPGWRAWVDGRAVDVGAEYGGLLRSVRLEEGAHHIVLRFLPVSVLAGVGLCALALGWLLLRAARRRVE